MPGKTVKEQIRLDKRRFPRSIFLTRGQRYSPLAAFRVQTQNRSYCPSTANLTLYRSRNVPNLVLPILVALPSKTRRSAHQYRTELLCNLSFQYTVACLSRLTLWQGSLHRFSSRSAELMTYWEAVHDIPSTQDVSRGGRFGGLFGGNPRPSAACLSRRSARRPHIAGRRGSDAVVDFHASSRRLRHDPRHQRPSATDSGQRHHQGMPLIASPPRNDTVDLPWPISWILSKTFRKSSPIRRWRTSSFP